MYNAFSDFFIRFLEIEKDSPLPNKEGKGLHNKGSCKYLYRINFINPI